MGVNSLIFLLLSSSFDPRVVPLWNCVRSMDNKNTGINPSLVRQPGKGVSVSWRRWEEELLMFSFPLFLSHSPAPKVVPVMDLQLPWQPKTLRKINKTKEKICFWSGQLRKGDVVIWRLWRNTCWFFSFSFLLLLCLQGSPSHMELYSQQQARTPREALSFQAEDQEKEPLRPRKHGRSAGA